MLDTKLTIPQVVYEAFFPKHDMTKKYYRWTDYQVVYVGPLGADPKTLAAEIRTLSFQGWHLDRIFGDFLFLAKERWCEIVDGVPAPSPAPDAPPPVGDSTAPESDTEGVE